MRQHVLFEGYATPEGVRAPFDADGWFATGDRVRIDEDGDLVFVERFSESIRVGGEYVPISFVERHFAAALSGDVAIWREPGALEDDAVVLYVAGAGLDPDLIAERSRIHAHERWPRVSPRLFSSSTATQCST